MHLRFDRGTVLVDDPPSGLDLSAIPGFLWDPRVQAFRAPARYYAAITAELARLGVRLMDDVQAVDESPERFEDINLRPYQDAALAAWELGDRRGIVALPTGSGKTRIALAAMARTALSTLCLVPTRVLLEQWLHAIQEVYPGTIGCYGDGDRQLAPICVATYESAYRHMDRIGNRFGLLVVDEVHHFGGGHRDEILDMAIAPARLGLTATPPRGQATLDRLAGVIGPVVYELAIGDLAGRFLAEFDVVRLHLDLTPSERARYECSIALFHTLFSQFRRLAPEASWQDFVYASSRTVDGRRALQAWRETRQLLGFTEAKRNVVGTLLARHRDSRLLVFTASNESAYEISRQHLLMPLTCDIGRKEREDVLDRFRAGKLRTLVSARVLNEGLDVPEAGVAVIVGAALGEREHVQRVGRLLRPSEGKRAIVYEFVTRKTIEVEQARRRGESLAPRVAAAG